MPGKTFAKAHVSSTSPPKNMAFTWLVLIRENGSLNLTILVATRKLDRVL